MLLCDMNPNLRFAQNIVFVPVGRQVCPGDNRIFYVTSGVGTLAVHGSSYSDIQENGRSPLTLLKVTEKSYRKRFSTKEGAMKTFFISKGMRTPCVCSPTSSSGAAKGALP